MKSLVSVLVVFLFCSSGFANYKFDAKSGKVEFKAKGWPSLLKIKGKGEGFVGSLVEKEGVLNGDLVFNLKTLKTGIELRDDHLKNKYLKVDKNPSAKLSIENLTLPKKKKGKLKFKAKLTLNGVTKEISVVSKISPKGKGLKVTANFKIKLSDFKIEIPSFKGITVAEDVEVKVESSSN